MIKKPSPAVYYRRIQSDSPRPKIKNSRGGNYVRSIFNGILLYAPVFHVIKSLESLEKPFRGASLGGAAAGTRHRGPLALPRLCDY